MSKSVAELPAVTITDDDIASGALPSLLARAALQHGPIVRRRMSGGPQAGQELIFLVGPEANRFVMHTHREHFSHDLGWTPIIGEDFGHGLLNMDDPEHARHRKMWNPAFTAAYMATYLPVMQRVIAEHTAQWVTRDAVDLYHESREITFDVAAAALAGFHTGPEMDRLRELFYLLLHGFDGTESWDEYRERALRTRGELVGMLLALIAARRNLPAGEAPRDVLGLIVQARDEDGRALSDEQVLAHLNILLIAGHETTTTLSAWVLHVLATRPDHYRRIRAEVEALPGGPDGTPGIEALRSATALDAFIREAGRLYPPVINVPRGVLHDVEFEGYTLRAGTQVRLALAASHRLPTIFEHPDVFDPDRFAPPREEDRRSPYALVTFGGGSRVCIGINFAQIEVKALTAHVLRHYRIEAVGDRDVVHAGYWTAMPPQNMLLRATPLA